MSKALYRKYRSKSLDEVVGQSHITDILSRSLKEDKIAHAYLFTGPRGVGKTSIARILAHEINKLPYTEDATHLDIIEIDAASNNGVDDIRDLRERVQLAPVSAEKKVYIIDEVHMLSKPAFNALLKTLEEPPAHIVFILATTDADKLPDTIISRTQRFNFRTIPTSEAAAHLGWIAKQEGVVVEPGALELIAIHGEGSFRDSISLLDQLRGTANEKTGITKQFVETFLGLPPIELIDRLLVAYETGTINEIVTLLDSAKNSGAQPAIMASELIRAIRSEITTRPQLLPLLDELLEVARSSRPDIKLLTVLAGNLREAQTTQPIAKQKTAALVVTPPPAIAITPEEKPIIDVGGPKIKSKPKESAPKKPAIPLAEFDWDKALSHIQKNDIALFSVVSRCSVVAEGDILTFYTGNAFYKKKLDTAKYRSTLLSLLENIGMRGFTVETIGTTAPPKDELVASVASIMGGGEEYVVEDTGKNT